MISLYFHFPFCTRKCPYCHFYVIPNRNQEPFIKALIKEWELRLPWIENRPLTSLYFGGGTPSLCVEGIRQILKRTHAPEITVETNPEDVTPELMKTLHGLGVNRISIGVQTLSNPLLKHLGRTHTAQQAMDAAYITQEAGIENISIDLMYELPHQTLEMWQDTVKTAAALPITHLSLYNLTIEPHTLFKKKEEMLRPHLPDEETCAAMLEFACNYFESQGLHRYEISAFARKNHVSIHNTGYWTGREFIGYGPSAFSYWEGKRFRNVCHQNRYLKALEGGKFPVDFEERLPFPASLHEQIAIGLRMLEGISLNNLPQETQDRLADLDHQGWIVYRGNHARLTERGRLFYDTVAEQIIDE